MLQSQYNCLENLKISTINKNEAIVLWKTEKENLCIDRQFFQIYNRQNESEYISEFL